MSEREITLREDELFNLWKQDSLYKDKTHKFVTDGVFNVDAFLAQKTKIVFVLKEAVAEEGVNGFDLRDAVGGGKYHTTWNNITRWTRVILDNGDDDKTSWEKLKNISAKDRESALGNIAAINIKKTYGNASSNMDEIQQYALPLIWKQIEVYQPDIIVACGKDMAAILRSVSGLADVDWAHTKRGLWYWDANQTDYVSKFTPVIDFHHPQSRIRAAFMAYALMDAWSELKNRSN